MPIVIHGHPSSTCTRKLLCTFFEKKQEFDFDLVDFATGAHKKPPHILLQPWGQVPAIVDGDWVLYESRAICRYLDEKYATGNSLIPKDIKQRAVMEQWISIETSDITPPLMTVIGEYLFSSWRGAKPDQEKIAAAIPKCEKALDITDAHLAKNKFFAGDQFTIADISNLPYFEYFMATPAKDLIEKRPNVFRWWKEASSRPSWQSAIAYKAPAAADAAKKE